MYECMYESIYLSIYIIHNISVATIYIYIYIYILQTKHTGEPSVRGTSKEEDACSKAPSEYLPSPGTNSEPTPRGWEGAVCVSGGGAPQFDTMRSCE